MPTKKTTAASVPANPQKGTRVAGSMMDRIANLGVGQSISYAERLAFDEMLDPLAGYDILKKVRGGLAAYHARATAAFPKRKFRVESGMLVTDDKLGLLMVAVLTRSA